MEKQKELGISRFFRSYLRYCQSKNVSSIAQEPLFISKDSSSSTSLILPSICKPKKSDFITIKDVFDQRIKPKSSDTEETRCPHPSPEFQETKYTKRKERRKNYTKKKTIREKEIRDIMVSSNSSAANSHMFFTSDDERVKETEALLPSNSSSSNSHEFYHHPKKNTRKLHRRKVHRQIPDSGFIDFVIPKAVRGKVQRSIAVVKRSYDPYGDFRRSMVEMIVEKEMYTAGDLEQLLYCFLLLNSPHHHQVIVEVFSEILEALFPNWD